MSNLTKRLLTALIGIPIVAVLTYLGDWWFVVLVAALVLDSQVEFYNMVSPRVSGRHLVTGLALGIVIVLKQYTGLDFLPIVLLLLIGLLVLDTFDTASEKNFNGFAWMATGVVYPALLFSFAINLRHGWGDALTHHEGFLLIVGLLLIVWATDSMAYFTGRAIGKTPLAPAISPKKTWEGTIGGFFGAVLVAILLKLYMLPFLSWQDAIICALIGGIGGQIGDLVESRLKRIYGVKDSGKILPGHGGVLDRIDGLVLVIPLYYLYLAHFAAFAQ
ncbi:MAG: phosphatidate cytidylyltransferase [Rhodothermales bacterium]